MKLQILFLSFLYLPLSASRIDSTWVEHIAQPKSYLQQEAENNPSLYSQAFKSSLSSLQLSVFRQKANQPFVIEKGDGMSALSISAHSFLKLSSRTSVWGDAGYINGKHEHIKWNSASDYDRIQPYVMADSIGGNTQYECYHFRGGYGTYIKKWLIGGDFKFKASQEYRQQDPRTRSIISCIELSLGASRDIQQQRISIGGTLERYKQSNNVTFFNPLGNITQYHMTGLGTYYDRFTGNNNSLHYKGNGISLSLDISPKQQNGFYLHSKYSYTQIERIINTLNALPLSNLYTQQYDIHSGYERKHDGVNNVFIGASYIKRIGNENIVGDATSNIYPSLLFLTLYHAQNYTYYIGTQWSYHRFSAKLQTGINDAEQCYEYPQRTEHLRYWSTQLGLNYFCWLHSHLGLHIISNWKYQHNIKSQLELPKDAQQEITMPLITYNHHQASAHLLHGFLSMQLQQPLKKSIYQLYYQLSGGFTRNTAKTQLYQTAFSIGLSF